ncbi:MAG: hypothetical protein HY329_19420 [Chloroflexi bacterium]|nr:hypothetical protein [Chloroflexota bacterium]
MTRAKLTEGATPRSSAAPLPTPVRLLLRTILVVLLYALGLVGLVGGFCVWYVANGGPISYLIGDSMQPELDQGYVVYSVPADQIRRGDIVRYWGFMHRVVALPGETVEARGGDLFVTTRGQTVKLVEPYVSNPHGWSHPPATLGPDEYLILSDNRYYPAVLGMFDVVQRDEITRKLDRILWPLSVARHFSLPARSDTYPE